MWGTHRSCISDEHGRSASSEFLVESDIATFFDQVDMTYDISKSNGSGPKPIYIYNVYNPSIRGIFLGFFGMIIPAISSYGSLWTMEGFHGHWLIAALAALAAHRTSSKLHRCQDDDDEEEKPAYNMDNDDDWAEQQHQGRSENGASNPHFFVISIGQVWKSGVDSWGALFSDKAIMGLP